MPKKKSNPRPPKPPLELLCEYDSCNQVFSRMEDFTAHVTQHLGTYSLGDRPLAVQTFPCPWYLCGSRIQGLVTDFIRHIYFHSFHVKIKCLGQQMIDQDQLNSCTLDKSGRNLIPELPERLQCGWESCQVVLDIPETFYRHVDCHAHSYPEGNNVEGGCKCFWEGCDAVFKSKYKLREHLRSHTQEKIVACPVCGGLFSNRTKFLDHLKRQADSNDLLYQCSHCQKRFSSERLLRDHVRHHVNQYKCPCCDMTCATPSSLKQHLRYRHTNEKPFQCEHCEFGAKTVNDLRRHLESHNTDAPYHCHMADCDYACRNYITLTNHFKREHNEENLQKYMCHVCGSAFSRGSKLTVHLKKKHKFRWPSGHCRFRGSKLTVHLKKKHKFRWPSGHCRFRYRMGEDGFWRLQTVRYESMHLTEQRSSTATSSTESVSGVGSDKEHTGQAAVSAEVKQTLEVLDQNQNASGGMVGGVYKEYTELVNVDNENSNSSYGSGSSRSSAFHIDEGENAGSVYQLSNYDNGANIVQSSQIYKSAGKVSPVKNVSPAKKTANQDMSQGAFSSIESLGASSVLDGANLSMPQLSNESEKKLAKGIQRKSRSTGKATSPTKLGEAVPVQLVDTGCVINIPNYEQSPSKQTKGLQVVSMRFNDSSEDMTCNVEMTYNLEMLGDVALLVPSGSNSKNVPNENDSSRERNEKRKQEDSKQEKGRMNAKKRSRRSEESEDGVGKGNSRKKKAKRSSDEQPTVTENSTSVCVSDNKNNAVLIQNSSPTTAEERDNMVRRTRKGSPVKRQSLPRSPSPGEKSLPSPDLVPPSNVNLKKNGRSKVVPRVKARLGKKDETSNKVQKSSEPEKSQSGSLIEKIARERSPVKPRSSSSDIFSLFPGPRTRRKDRESV